MSIVMSMSFFPTKKNSNAEFLGNLNLVVTADDVEIMNHRCAVRTSQFGGYQVDGRHAQFVADKNSNGKPIVKDGKPQGKWYNQSTLGDHIQEGANGGVNLAWGKTRSIELTWNPKTGKWRATPQVGGASSVSMIEDADAFMAASVAASTNAVENAGEVTENQKSAEEALG